MGNTVISATETLKGMGDNPIAIGLHGLISNPKVLDIMTSGGHIHYKIKREEDGIEPKEDGPLFLEFPKEELDLFILQLKKIMNVVLAKQTEEGVFIFRRAPIKGDPYLEIVRNTV